MTHENDGSSGDDRPPLRWGILGCGMIANDYVRALSLCRHRNQVVAVAASTQQRADDFHRSLKLKLSAKAYGSYERLLEDANVEVVYIALINASHFEWTLKALDAGKHVLCEKPMGVNAAQVRRMVERARERKRFLMEAFWSRFFPAWQYVRKTIDSERLGEVLASSVNIGITLPESCFDVGTCQTPLMSIGVYTVALSMFIFGGRSPEKVHVVGDRHANGSDKWGSITLMFGGGGHAVCHFASPATMPCSGFISFERGGIQIPDYVWSPTRLIETSTTDAAQQVSRKGAEKRLLFPLFQGADDAAEAEAEREFRYAHSSGLRYEADHVAECIRQRQLESGVMSLDESVRLHRLIDEIRRQLAVIFAEDAAERK